MTELKLAYDTFTVSGKPAASSWRTSLRLGYGFAVTSEGDEVILGVDGALRSWDDPERNHVLLAFDARYRNYFGTEHLKTFFDAGLWVPVKSRVGIGPLLGLGVLWDFDRAFGAFATAAFGTAFGEARIASFSVAAGLQVRFE